MFYGHGAGGWTVLVFFGALFAMRMVASQRRRAGRRRQAPNTWFANPGRGGPQGPPPGGPAPAHGAFTGIAPGWFADPTGKHDQRYWSGSDWTEHVTDGGAPGTDPPPPTPAP